LRTDGVATALLTLTAVGPHGSNDARLIHLATHDGLTGLTNRTRFVERVNRTLAEPLTPSALLFIDLDRFKIVNDHLGHHYGNIVLQAVCKRIQSTIRSTDLAGRLGGDEIGVFCPRTTGRDEVIALAERIRAALAAPFSAEEEIVIIDASIGIAFTTDTVRTADELIDNADRAMYVAKAAGGGRWATHDEDIASTVDTFAPDPRPLQLRAAHDIAVAVAQATGMIAQRSGADVTQSARALHEYAVANNMSFEIAATLLVERAIDIDAVIARSRNGRTRDQPADRLRDRASEQTVPSEQLGPLHEAYGEHSAAVFACASFITGSAAMTVTEQVFVTFFEQGESNEPGTPSVRIQLLTIAHRLALHAALSGSRTRDDDRRRGASSTADAVAQMLGRSRAIECMLACAPLTAAERSIAALVIYGRCGDHEAARVLGMLEDDVSEQLRSGFRHVRAELAARGCG
jgi:diguanylate cyclase (GGDEF)-like protein